MHIVVLYSHNTALCFIKKIVNYDHMLKPYNACV